MNKKLSINSGISTGSPINDALQNFVSVYSCPIDYETAPIEHFPTYSTETYQMSNIVSGKAFTCDKNRSNEEIIKDILNTLRVYDNIFKEEINNDT